MDFLKLFGLSGNESSDEDKAGKTSKTQVPDAVVFSDATRKVYQQLAKGHAPDQLKLFEAIDRINQKPIGKKK